MGPGIAQAILLVVFVVNVIALWRLLPRFGLSKWLALPGFIPLVAFILVWIMAFGPGPRRDIEET